MVHRSWLEVRRGKVANCPAANPAQRVGATDGPERFAVNPQARESLRIRSAPRRTMSPMSVPMARSG
jgi:hypothetical protein